MKKRTQIARIVQRGFALVEALVVASVLVFGFVAANKIQVNMIKDRQSSSQGTQAVLLSEQSIEQLRNYSSLTQYGQIAGGTSTASGANTSYSNAVAITTQSKYKTINQTVSWTNASSESKSIALTSYISQSDPQLSGVIFNVVYNSTPLPAVGSGTSQGAVSGGTTTTTNTNTTTNVTVPNSNIVLTYNSNDQVTQINNLAAVSIMGTITLATGTSAPPITTLLASVTVSPQTTNDQVATCFYSGATGIINCYMGRSWSGSILLGGISNVKVCTVVSQPYSNVLTSLSNQDYVLINRSSSCPSNAPYLLQTL